MEAVKAHVLVSAILVIPKPPNLTGKLLIGFAVCGILWLVNPAIFIITSSITLSNVSAGPDMYLGS